jgi:fructose/tagatose bisphosphate aldolase
MSKVNLATALMMAFTGGVRQGLEDPRTVDARIYLAAGRDAMRARVREYLWLLGSARLRMPLGS